MNVCTTALCILLLGLASPALARPVSYPGGWTVMQRNNGDVHALHFHYSPAADLSIGYLGEYWRGTDWQFHGAQLNYLFRRWNAPNAQANIYLKTGAGIAYSDFGAFDGAIEPAGFGGISMDFEDRRFFVSYDNRAYYAGDIEKFFTHNARVGITPYIGDYDDIHTWIMLQVDHKPEDPDNNHFTFTPMLRFFKDEYLVEAGMSDEGDAMFNWIVRY